MLADADVQLSTDRFHAEEQFSAWHHIVSETFVPIALQRTDDPPGFPSHYAGRRLGQLGLSWVASGPQVVDRTPELIRRRPGGVYFVNLPLQGVGHAEQDGRRSTTSAGDLDVVDGDRPFRLEFPESFAQISVVVPHEVLDPLLAEPGRATAVTVPGGDGLGAVAAAAIGAVARQRGRLTARQTTGVVDHVAGLLALSLSAALPGHDDGSRTAHLQAALDAIDRDLTDPDLTIGVIARRVSISTSYLTKLFAERGTTFGRLLLERRLDRAWAQLDPDLPGRTVTQVAVACGFRDSSHFSRVFRARFGRTPTQRLAG